MIFLGCDLSTPCLCGARWEGGGSGLLRLKYDLSGFSDHSWMVFPPGAKEFWGFRSFWIVGENAFALCYIEEEGNS